VQSDQVHVSFLVHNKVHLFDFKHTNEYTSVEIEFAQFKTCSPSNISEYFYSASLVALGAYMINVLVQDDCDVW
jgi:hypothetical protein